MNTVTQYSNFTIFKLTKDIFRNTGQYTLSFKRSNHFFNLNNEGINQIDNNVNNCIIDKNREHVCKYRPEVGKIKFMKNPKKYMHIPLGILVMKI